MDTQTTTNDVAQMAVTDTPAPSKDKTRKNTKARKARASKAAPVDRKDGAFQIPIGETGQVMPSVWRFGE